jgi:hypothetical protein
MKHAGQARPCMLPKVRAQGQAMCFSSATQLTEGRRAAAKTGKRLRVGILGKVIYCNNNIIIKIHNLR